MTFMDAAVLRDFFLGTADAEGLARELAYAMHELAPGCLELRMADLTEPFSITTAHLVRLCDAVLAGKLPPVGLADVGFALVASDHFAWDTDTLEGERVAETIWDWSAPEVNYRLTPETVQKFRHRLLTGEDTFVSADLSGEARAGVVTYRAYRTDQPASGRSEPA